MQLLATVRSRCTQLSPGGRVENRPEEKSELAMGYLKAVASGDESQLLRWCAQNEGLDNAAAVSFTEDVTTLLADMLCGREKSLRLTAADMMRLAALMEKCRDFLRVNVGVKHIFGLLSVDSIDSSGNRG